MNLMISDVALDLGVFALDGEIWNQSRSFPEAGDPTNWEYLAVAS